MPKAILLSRSPFFKAACSERWENNEVTKAIELPEDDPAVFGFYLHCVYKDIVNVRDTDELLDGEDGLDASSKMTLRMVETYSLADKLMDCRTANLVIDNLIEQMTEDGKIPGGYAINAAFDSTTDSSPLQRLMVDYYTYNAGVSAYQNLAEKNDVPLNFVLAVLLAKARVEKSNGSKKIDDVFDCDYVPTHRCEYHHHDDSHPKCSDKDQDKQPRIPENGTRLNSRRASTEPTLIEFTDSGEDGLFGLFD